MSMSIQDFVQSMPPLSSTRALCKKHGYDPICAEVASALSGLQVAIAEVNADIADFRSRRHTRAVYNSGTSSLEKRRAEAVHSLKLTESVLAQLKSLKQEFFEPKKPAKDPEALKRRQQGQERGKRIEETLEEIIERLGRIESMLGSEVTS